jgi:hypothetical protein
VFAATTFSSPALERIDTRQDYGEDRRISIGRTDDILLTVVYTDRAEAGEVARRNECGAPILHGAHGGDTQATEAARDRITRTGARRHPAALVPLRRRSSAGAKLIVTTNSPAPIDQRSAWCAAPFVSPVATRDASHV